MDEVTVAGNGTLRTRRDKKRAFKRIPKMPAAVSALWEAASEEERLRAHRTASAILETWLGKASRAEVAARLQVTPLRLWQLSQSALAGMLAGLLKQPRRRPMGALPLPPEEDPVQLRKRIEDLQRELALAEDLIAVLREMPGNKDRPPPTTAQSRRPKMNKAKAARRRAGGKKKRQQRQQQPPLPEVSSGDSGADDRELAG